ncbi:hypothetical protein T492DRAFT_1090183, partial [Pavlovales sp. CCMP2436]
MAALPRRLEIGGKQLRSLRFELTWHLPADKSPFGEEEQRRVLSVLARPLVTGTDPPEQLEVAFFREGRTVRLVVCVLNKKSYAQAIGPKYNLDVHGATPELVPFEKLEEARRFGRREVEVELGARQIVLQGGFTMPIVPALRAREYQLDSANQEEVTQVLDYMHSLTLHPPPPQHTHTQH